MGYSLHQIAWHGKGNLNNFPTNIFGQLILTLEKAMAPHSCTLAWKIPWTEEPGRLQFMESQRVGHDFTFTFHFHALEKEIATRSSVLAWRIPGIAEPGGLPSMGPHRVRHDWSDLAAAAAAICQRIRKTQEWPQDQFSFSLQKKAMPKNIQTTTQLHSSHTLANNAQNSPSQASAIREPWTSWCSS